MNVSVIVPAWGATPYLDEALASVRAQKGASVELVVAAPPQGAETLPRARREGLARATGDWVMFLDADDWLEPDAVAQMAAAVDAETDVVVSGLMRGGKKRLWKRDIWATGPSDVFNCVVAKLIRRELFEGLTGDPDVALGEDLMVTAQVLHKARKVAIVNEAFYHYRENPASMTHRLDGRKRVLDLMRVGEVLREALPEPAYAEFHDRVTRDAMLLWCRYRLCDRGLWRQMRSRLTGGLLDDPRHGLVKKGALWLAHCLFD